MWRGTVSFGLVNIPVRLQPAIKANDIHFHMLHDQDKSRLHREMVCAVENKEIPSEHIVRGYEVTPGRYIIVQDSELEALAPKASRAIEVLYFVDLGEIDPIYFQHPYYLVPEDGAEKSYALLTRAIADSKKVAVVKFVMRKKEYIGAIRVVQDALLLETMYFSQEILAPKDLPEGRQHVGERELKAAQQLIESLSGKFEPQKLKDDYREAVMDLVQRKAKGQTIRVEAEEPPEKTNVSDILAALEASLADARKKKQPAHA
jgi:DNA end-binding protein Ku